MSGRTIAAGLAVWLGLFSGTARAYSELTRFGEPASEGGGGGRWFTGSPADPYSCSVCHQGEISPRLTIQGLPSRYRGGQTYEIRITWPEVDERVSALLEFVDEQGRKVGQVRTPGPAQLEEVDQCQPVGFGFAATSKYDAPDGREVVGLSDCGGRRMRLQWTAPETDEGVIYFAGGLVSSNDQSDMAGDGVTEFMRPILSVQPEYTLEAEGGCSVSGSPEGSASLACLGPWILSRRRRRRG